jgi:NADH-quinone oxidoreductase subunit J
LISVARLGERLTIGWTTEDTAVLHLGYIVFVLIILSGAIVSILAKSLLRAAIALGAGSAALAVLFFLLSAPYAGGFELSVGAGLISVLFIIAISLTESIGRQQDEP